MNREMFLRERARRPFAGALILAIVLGISWPAAADRSDGETRAESSRVLATVDGKPITEAEVRSRAAGMFSQLEQEYRIKVHELLEAQLEEAIRDRLVEAEAEARKVSREEVLSATETPEITDADVDAFYEQNKSRINGTKEAVAGQIRDYLEQTRTSAAMDTFFANLEKSHKVENRLEPLRIDVAADGPSRGPADAPVTIVAFSDFECPYCSRMLPTLDEVTRTYGDRVRIVFRQFPLSFHPNARKAAEASLCADEQGKFWEMHDAMFANQKGLAVESLKTMAAGVGLDADSFNSCLDSGKYAAEVEADVKAGVAAGVSGTPGTFVNGRFISGAMPFDTLAELIDDELKRNAGK
jgi:protein-disulfide isomerase